MAPTKMIRFLKANKRSIIVGVDHQPALRPTSQYTSINQASKYLQTVLSTQANLLSLKLGFALCQSDNSDESIAAMSRGD
jgi:hypothetical protein